MTWPLKSSLADILNSGPDPSDPPEEDWAPLAELERAVEGLAVRLRHEPGLSRAAAMLHVKLVAPDCSIHFRSLIWPQAPEGGENLKVRKLKSHLGRLGWRLPRGQSDITKA